MVHLYQDHQDHLELEDHLVSGGPGGPRGPGRSDDDDNDDGDDDYQLRLNKMLETIEESNDDDKYSKEYLSKLDKLLGDLKHNKIEEE